ncbi:MAG: tRNA-dihydrouridine synthase [Spirochaetes bacterium]|nr:MAG: tRNA-dihydrouridine synthase [Spirochaetota bacterium]
MPADSSSSNPDPKGEGEGKPQGGGLGLPVLAGLTLPSPFFLAPVAGYSDAAFRSICFELGAGLCYTEMVSAEALIRNNGKTEILMERSEAETRYAIQLFGAKPESLAKAVEKAAAHKPLAIDLNCGCPVPKIVKSGAGSALLRDPKLLGTIVKAMTGASSVPVTVKIRTGWDETSINYLETAMAAVEAGASAVTLHGRTRAQGYAGKADWEAIRALAAALSPLGIPVYGSGDAFDAQSALGHLASGGVQGVMIARGAMGNPYIFAQALALWQNRPYQEPSPREIAQTASRHLRRAAAFMGEDTACREFRKHFCAYSKGLPGGSELRNRAVRCSSLAEFQAIIAALA